MPHHLLGLLGALLFTGGVAVFVTLLVVAVRRLREELGPPPVGERRQPPGPQLVSSSTVYRSTRRPTPRHVRRNRG